MSLRPFHLAFPVHDLAAARRFYGETMGCPEGRSSAEWVDFFVEALGDGTMAKVVNYIGLAGLIASFSVDASGNNMVESIRRQFKWAREDDAVKAVLFRINSPGGEVLASDHICEIIRDFQDESDKPVVAVMGALAASGGYYVAAPCNLARVRRRCDVTAMSPRNDAIPLVR